MSELIDKEALITKLLTLPGVGSNSDALETIKHFPTCEPQKPVVPPELAEYIQENEGESIGDVFSYEWLTHYDNQQLGDKVAKWLFDNDREENNRRCLIAVQAFITGDYDVEKEPVWGIKNADGNYLTKCALWGKDGVNYSFEFNPSYRLLFTDKEKAAAAALLVNGTAEEVAEG